MIFVCQFYKINFKMYVKVYLLCFVSVMYSELNPKIEYTSKRYWFLNFKTKLCSWICFCFFIVYGQQSFQINPQYNVHMNKLNHVLYKCYLCKHCTGQLYLLISVLACLEFQCKEHELFTSVGIFILAIIIYVNFLSLVFVGFGNNKPYTYYVPVDVYKWYNYLNIM